MDENPPRPDIEDNYADEIKNVPYQTPNRPENNRGAMGQFASHIGPSPIQNSEVMKHLSAPEKTLNVLKKGTKNQANQLLTTIQVALDSSLVQIDEKVLQQFPALKNRPFHYLCRGKPVYKEHWDIFHMKFFPEVVIGKGAPPEIDEDGVPQGGSAPRPSIITTGGQAMAPPGHGMPPAAGRMLAQDNHRGAPNPAAGMAAVFMAKKPPQTQGEQPSPNPSPDTGAGGPTHGITGGGPSATSAISSTPQEAPKPKPKVEKKTIPPDAIYVRAKYPYDAQTPTNISFAANDILLCIKHEKDSQWWFGHQTDDSKKGWFPASYVEPCDPPDAEESSPPEPEPQPTSARPGGPGAGGPGGYPNQGAVGGARPGMGGGPGGGGPPGPPGGGGASQFSGGSSFQPSQVAHPNNFAQGLKTGQNGSPGPRPGGPGGMGGVGGPGRPSGLGGAGGAGGPRPGGPGGLGGPGGAGGPVAGGPGGGASPSPAPFGGGAPAGGQSSFPGGGGPPGPPPSGADSNGAGSSGPPGPPGDQGGFPGGPGGAPGGPGGTGAPPPFPGGPAAPGPAGGLGASKLGPRKAGGYLPKKGNIKPVQKRGRRNNDNKLLNASRNMYN